MDLLKKISRLNYTIIIISFFFPFIMDQCEADSKKSKEKAEVTDTISTDPDFYIDSIGVFSDNGETNAVENSEGKKSKKFLTPLIRPDGENLSGIGFILIYFDSIIRYSSIPAALSIAIACLIRRTSRKYPKEKKTLILCIIGFLSLIGLMLVSEWWELKTGYWLALGLYFANCLIDLKIFIEWKKLKVAFYDNNY